MESVGVPLPIRNITGRGCDKQFDFQNAGSCVTYNVVFKSIGSLATYRELSSHTHAAGLYCRELSSPTREHSSLTWGAELPIGSMPVL